mgnify:CR=1 FL=1
MDLEKIEVSQLNVGIIYQLGLIVLMWIPEFTLIKMKKLIVGLLVVFVALVSLYVSDNETNASSSDNQKNELLKEMVKRINEQAPQTHPITGVILKGAMTTGNTLIYMYEVLSILQNLFL